MKKIYKILRNYSSYMILFIAVMILSLQPVRAQTPTSLSVLPAASEVELVAGESITLTLRVKDAVDLNAFDLTLTYDPNIVKLDSWAYGDMLSNLSPLVEADQPGSLQVAATQLNQPAVNGEGDLLRLTFSGVAVGQTPITLASVIFADKAGVQTTPELSHGVLVVWYPRHTLTGRVTLQGQSEFDGIPVALSTGATYAYGPYTTLTTAASTANLLLDLVVEDVYVFTTQQPRYLNIHAGLNVEVDLGADLTLPDLELIGGNAVWTDNVIDISDASVVGAMYDMTQANLDEGETLDGDVNYDGRVTILDLALVAGNYGQTSEEAYAGWAP